MRRPGTAFALALLIGAASALAAAPAVRGKLERPAYVAGDGWVYDLRGSLGAFPGTNASEVGSFSFDLRGRVDVDVRGTDQVDVGGVPSAVVRVATRATGFLNGTFDLPNSTFPGTVTGTFTSNAAELWNASSFLPVASTGTTTYLASISLFITIDLTTSIRIESTTAYASHPAFDLDVGESASASFASDILANTTISGLGAPISSENATTVAGTWRREVLAETNVSVDAGTFPVFVMNQTLTGFPGLAGLVPPEGANETAYWSNGAGNYVKRDAYANGTEIAEMSLRSTTYPYRPGLSALALSLVVGVPLLALVATVLFVRRRRKAKPRPTPGGEPPAR
ncbi:MAG TPA: hypothetical protein VI915_03995 [Thermoplasmata archaeon]|nr:hypothetical protein [Thermoplasmata archaeon]HLE46130.1 hypothetical protein [Thermoplasmata archaeon]